MRKGNDFHGWAIHTDGGTRFSDFETFVGSLNFLFWSVYADAPLRRKALYDNGGAFCLFHLYLLVFARLPDSDEYDEHNIWNPMLNLFCLEYVGAVMESYLDEEAVLGRIALSCPFALDFPRDKAEFHYGPMLKLAVALSLPFWSTRLGCLV